METWLFNLKKKLYDINSHRNTVDAGVTSLPPLHPTSTNTSIANKIKY